MKIYLFPGTYYSPPARFRILQFEEYFKQFSTDLKIIVPYPDRKNNYPAKFSFLNKIIPIKVSQVLRIIFLYFQTFSIRSNSLVIINRDITPDLKFVFFENLFVRRGAKLVFDFDDAIFLGAREKKIKSILKICSAVVCGNNYLLNFASSFNKNSFLIPTVVDTHHYFSTSKLKSNTITLGWIGSEGTKKKHLPLLKSIIIKLSKEFKFRFHIMADSNPKFDWKLSCIKFFKWNANKEINFFKDIDIGLMPLTDDEFDKGKCGFKAIQFMSCEIPVVASPTEANKLIIDHNKNGFLAKDDQEWYKYLKLLILDKKKRIDFGVKARKKIDKSFSMYSAERKWCEIINFIKKSCNE